MSASEFVPTSSSGGLILVSFSGGRTSALLARMMQVSPLWSGHRKIFVYANTGKEREETLRFIKECDERWSLGVVWVEAAIDPRKRFGTKHRIVSFESAIRNTDPASEHHPFIAMVKKYGIPTHAFPHCTRELKERPIASFMASTFPGQAYQTAIGIRADEAHRVKAKPGYIYPLVDLRIDEEAVRTFWDRQGFDLGLKDYEGNCDLCFKKSLRKRLTILAQNPQLASFWAALEGERVNPRGLVVDVGFDRDGFRVPELLEMSRSGDFSPAIDRHDARLANPELLPRLACVDLDFEKPCHCSADWSQNAEVSRKAGEKTL